VRVPESCDYLCEIISLSPIKFPCDPEGDPEVDPEGDPEGAGSRSRSRSRSIFPLRDRGGDLFRSIFLAGDHPGSIFLAGDLSRSRSSGCSSGSLRNLIVHQGVESQYKPGISPHG